MPFLVYFPFPFDFITCLYFDNDSKQHIIQIFRDLKKEHNITNVSQLAWLVISFSQRNCSLSPFLNLYDNIIFLRKPMRVFYTHSVVQTSQYNHLSMRVYSNTYFSYKLYFEKAEKVEGDWYLQKQRCSAPRRHHERHHQAAESAMVGQRAGHSAVFQRPGDPRGRSSHRRRRARRCIYCFQVLINKMRAEYIMHTRIAFHILYGYKYTKK